jgi:hypothetical protein
MAALVVAGSATAASASARGAHAANVRSAAHAAGAHAAGASKLGTATATVAAVGLDVRLLPVLGAGGLDVPLNLTLNQQTAPTDGTDVNQTVSALRLRDGLLNLVPSSQSPNLLDADVASSTVRTTSTYSQAYVTLANVRLFLPFVALPSSYADDGVLRLDAVSAWATCNAGQRPSAQFQMPAEVTLFGQDLRLPDNGRLSVNIPLLGSISLRIGPSTSTSASAAAASVAASLDINVLGLAEVAGTITLASASCTEPTVATTSGATPTTSPSGGTTTTGTPQVATTTSGLMVGQTGGGMGTAVPVGAAVRTTSAPTGTTLPRDQLTSARFASLTSPGPGGMGVLQPLILMGGGALLTIGCVWLLRRRPAFAPLHARRRRR